MKSGIEGEVQAKLFELKDGEYRDFQCKLMPTVDKNAVIGVRTPMLRKFAREFARTTESAEFMEILPHKYYEENNLHAFLIERITDFDECIAQLDRFLPYVNNWATCDSMRPKIFEKHLPELRVKINDWLKSGATYTVRFGIEMLMSFFLDGCFEPEYPELVASVCSEEYYVNMMKAWYFATALAKQYETVMPYIEQYRLDEWTHNKAIQKAVESYRITDEQKRYLRTLKIKNERKVL